MKYVNRRDLILENVSDRDYDMISLGFMDRDKKVSSIPDQEDIKSPKLTKILQSDLNFFRHILFAYKKGRRNVYFIFDAEEYKIVAEQESGDFKKFTQKFIYDKIFEELLPEVMDIFTIRESEKGIYSIKVYAIDNSSILYRFFDISTYTNSVYITTDESKRTVTFLYSKNREEYEIAAVKQFNPKEFKKIHNHIVNNKEGTNYREYLFY